MKIQDLKNKLEKQLQKPKEKRMNLIRKEYRKEKRGVNSKDTKELKIIGITGSTGKTSVAVMVHEYLKALGYKSILYSSAYVDSPASYIKAKEAYEVAVASKEALLRIIEEAEAYGAEYVVLEINESTIAKGIFQDVDFDVRALTNLNPKHNMEQYTEKAYVEIKKSFFKDVNESCICVIGLQDYEKELYEELMKLNNCEKLTFTSNYIAKAKGVDPAHITCLLNELDLTAQGLKIGIKMDQKQYPITVKEVVSYQALNLLCAMTILKALDKLDVEQFEKKMHHIEIPGRAQMYNVSGRMIVVDTRLPKMLEYLQTLKNKGMVQNIKVVVGSLGSGYKSWDNRFNQGTHFEKRHETRKYAMDLLKQYADFVYLTENDPAAESVLEICQELQGYLNQEVPSKIIEDRKEAIRTAILESQPKDVIFISGRGNRRVLCNSATTIKLVKDSEVVEEVVKELGW